MAKLVGKDDSVVETLDSLDESLEVLQPEEEFVDIDGERIYVKPYTFGKLLRALKHLSKLQDVLDSGQEALEANLLEAIAEHGDDVVSLISLATDIPVEFFDEIPSDKGLDLAIMTYKVNESFFVKHLLPKLQELFPSDLPTQDTPVAPTEKKSKKAGSTSSKS